MKASWRFTNPEREMVDGGLTLIEGSGWSAPSFHTFAGFVYSHRGTKDELKVSSSYKSLLIYFGRKYVLAS